MGDYKHRSAARVVGWIDWYLVLTILQFVFVIYWIIEIIKIMRSKNVHEDSELNNLLEELSEKEWSSVKDTLIVIMGLIAIFTVIQFIAAIALILATKEYRPPKKALKLVKFWRGVTITFVVFGVMGSLFMLKDGHFFELLSLMVPIAFLVLVHPFLKELKDAAW